MEAKYGEFVGVENLHVAPVTADTADGIDFGKKRTLFL